MKKNILFILQHPAHVHQFKFNIKFLKREHNVFVLAIEKDITTTILRGLEIEYLVISKSKSGITNKLLDIIPQLKLLYGFLTKNDINLVVSRGNVAASIICGVMGIKHIIFSDSEPVVIDKFLLKFASKIVTPSSYKSQLGIKNIKINSYKELAYLHPDYFVPDDNVYNLLGLKKNQKFFIIRLVAWTANHDLGHAGLNDENIKELISILEKAGHVYISSEKHLKPGFEKYRFSINPLKMHDALFFASALICDSQTMATESALLATPAIRINSFVGKNDMGNFIELENRYDLIYNFKNFDTAREKIELLSTQKKIKEQWLQKREKLLREKTDMTKEMLNIINNELN